MKRLFFILTISIIGCTYANLSFSINEDYYSKQLQASYFYNKGELDKALELLKALNEEAKDTYIYSAIANIYISKGEFEKAELTIKEGLEYSEDPELLFKLGILYGKIYKDCESALPYLEKAIKIDDKDTYLLATAECYEDKKDYSSAIELYNKLTEKDRNPEYYYRKGVLYTKLNLLQKAKGEYLKAIEFGQHVKSYLNLAEINILGKNYEEAIKLLNDVLKKYGDILVAEERLAELYKQTGDIDKAVETFNLIVERLKGNPKALILKQIGLLYIDKKDFKMARESFLKSVEIDPTDYQALYFIGFSNELLRDYENAVNYYKKVLELRDDFTFAKKRLAITFINLGKFDEASEILNNLTNDDIDVEYYLIKSLLYKKQNNMNKALKILNDAYSHYPNSLEVLFELASLYEEMKQYEECEKIINKALSLEPENPIFLNFLGYLYAELNKKLDEAYRLINKALVKDPDNPAYIDSMAWVLYRMNRYQEAYEWQRKALKYDPEEEEFIKHMRAIMKALGVNKSIDEIIQEN